MSEWVEYRCYHSDSRLFGSLVFACVRSVGGTSCVRSFACVRSGGIPSPSHERANTRTSEHTNTRTSEHTNTRTSEHTNTLTHEHANTHIDCVGVFVCMCEIRRHIPAGCSMLCVYAVCDVTRCGGGGYGKWPPSLRHSRHA